MLRRTRNKLGSFIRIRDELRDKTFQDPSYLGIISKFLELLARLLGLAVEETSGTLQARAAVRRRAALRAEALTELRYIAEVADVAALEHPMLANQFRVPRSRASATRFLADARNLLNLAAEHREILARYGLPAAVLDQTVALVAEFEATGTTGNDGVAVRVGANEEQVAVTRDLSRLVRLIDGIVRRQYRDDPSQLAAWESAVNVPGRGRSKPANGVHPADPTTPAPNAGTMDAA